MSFFGSLLDNMAQNALGAGLLNDPNSQQPQTGLLAQNQQQQFAQQPTLPKQALRGQYLMALGQGLKTGNFADAMGQYQQNVAGQLQMARAQQMQARQQQLMGQFSQEMQAAGTDPTAQARVAAKYAAFLPAQDIKALSSVMRVEKQQDEPVGNPFNGKDPTTGQPVMLQRWKSGKVTPIQGYLPQTKYLNVGNGWMVNENDKNDKVQVGSGDPIKDPQYQAALILANGDQKKAAQMFLDSKQKAQKDDKVVLAERAAAGDQGAKTALQLLQPQNRTTVNMGATPGSPDFNGWAAQQMAAGNLSLEQLKAMIPSRGQGSGAQIQTIVTQAHNLNKNLNLTANSGNVKNLTSTQTTAQIKNIDNTVRNLDAFGPYAQAVGNGDSQSINHIKQLFKAQFGDVDVTNFRAARGVLINEVAKALTGNGSVTDAARTEAAQYVPEFGSYQQMMGAMGVARQELARRRNVMTANIDYSQQPEQQAQPSPAGRPQFKAGDMVMYQGKQHKVMGVNPQTGKLILEN